MGIAGQPSAADLVKYSWKTCTAAGERSVGFVPQMLHADGSQGDKWKQGDELGGVEAKDRWLSVGSDMW